MSFKFNSARRAKSWEFRPKMVRELEAKGTLMEALFEAQERTIEEMEALG
jgi:hypothetical protein